MRTIATNIGDILRSHDLTLASGITRVQSALKQYAEVLTPWAEAAAKRMVTEVAQRDERSWFQVSAKMGRALKQEIAEAPTGAVMRALQAQQVGLITSLPEGAAERVQRIAREHLSSGMRPETLAQHLMETEDVTASRARMIARTETSRASTLLTQARAEHIGATHFYWRTAGDVDVRPSHKKLDGKRFAWAEPPLCDLPDHHALPGAIWNCRCYAEPDLEGL